MKMNKQELIEKLRIEGIKKEIIEAINKIPRELFIPEEYKDQAYEDYPLPIGHEQTISQPSLVAQMIQYLELKKGNKVLELGTGSGWNASLIAYLINPGKIFTIERIEKLADFAKNNIKKIGLKNIEVIHADGSKGYKTEAPYDKIIITANCDEYPKNLYSQLKKGGILLAPINNKLIRIRKNKKIEIEDLGGVIFVPLLKGKY